MNFNTLHYFLVVAEELNITRAATRLFISQQSLSNQIIKLEKELGVTLFNRTPVFSLTYAGNRLAKSATQIMNIRRIALNELDDITKKRRGELKIGISHTRGRAVLPEILPLFHEIRPLVELTLTEANSETLEYNLQHGMLDVIISFAPFTINSAETVELCDENLTLLVHNKFMTQLFGSNSENMKENFRKNFDIRAFADIPFLMLKEGNRLRAVLNTYFINKGISPDIVLETENIETAFRLALAGMGLLVYPEMYVKKISSHIFESADCPLSVFPIPDINGGRLAIGYSHNHYLSAAARDFIDITVDFFKKKYN